MMKVIEEIKSYNGRIASPEYLMDLDILSKELGDDYTVKVWTFGKHLRVAVIHGGYSL